METTETPAVTGETNESNQSQLYNEAAEESTSGTECDTKIVATLPDPQPTKTTTPPEKQEESLRDALVRMVHESGCTLFHDSSDSTYVSVPINGHEEHWRLRSDGFRRWIRHEWHAHTGQGLGTSVIADAMETLDALAAYSGHEKDVHIRTAKDESGIYIDLCDAQWRAIHITAEGWNVVNNVPVPFIRTKGMLPLPVPEVGGRIDELRPLINAPTDDIWVLIVAWLLAAFSSGPFPILVLLGEQGSSKSFLCKILRDLVDPSEAAVTTAPREARDVIMAANNAHLIALDNVSGIQPWLSDLLCSIATGAAHRERKYHTNNGDEELFRVKRPVVLNGIDFAVRDDLMSRSFVVNLPVIPVSNRQDELQLESAIKAAAPRVLAGICDVLSFILKQLPNTKIATLPRMADAALWVTAAESALGWSQGHFMRIYGGNRDQSTELALESDSFGLALYQYMMDGRTECVLGWEDLMNCLSDGQTKPGWPKNSKGVGTVLKRLAPALRHFGIHWKHERVGAKRYYKIWTDVADVANVAASKPVNITEFHQQSAPVSAPFDVAS